MLYPTEEIIHAGNFANYINPVVNGETKLCGTVPRDPKKFYRGCYPGIAAVDVPLIPATERPKRIADQLATKGRISDITRTGLNGGPIPPRDQNSRGYCWMHSGVSAMICLRAIANLPYADLSAFGPACKVKSFRDEGGWGAQGVDFLMANGCPTSKTWPQKATDRSLDNAATWAEAAKYKIAEGWMDLAQAQYDRNLSFDQVISLVISGIPVVVDFNWWSHSVCAVDAVDGTTQYRITRDVMSGKLLELAEFELVWGIHDPVTAGLAIRILNSWGNWSDAGYGVLTGSQAVPNGSVAPRSVLASLAA